MSEVKRYYVGDAGLVEGESLGRINVVLGSDYDQLVCKVGNMVCAKRQMDEELEIARDDLVIFKGALSALGEASKKLVVCARTTGGTAGPDQGLMDACDGVEGVITLAGVARAMNEFERVTAERDALQLRLTIADQRIDDLRTSKRQCQFPQSCTTRCDCIPDFSPGNGNKARRRAQAIEALKPENQRVVPVQPDDPLSTCLGCFGTGTICKIEEASPTTCNECNGTGRENL